MVRVISALVFTGLLSACSLVTHEVTFGSDAGERDVQPSQLDAGRVDAGPDSGLDATAAMLDAQVLSDSGNDPSDAGSSDDACVGTCYRDQDDDGHGDDLESQPGCMCPSGWVSDASGLDCADNVSDAHPGQTAFFHMAYSTMRGGLSINSFDYNCDGTSERQEAAPCALGLSGSCTEGFEGPGAYDPSTTLCGYPVQWIRCHTDCSFDDLGMQPLPCR